jgi:hypothetical protein
VLLSKRRKRRGKRNAQPAQQSAPQTRRFAIPNLDGIKLDHFARSPSKVL